MKLSLVAQNTDVATSFSVTRPFPILSACMLRCGFEAWPKEMLPTLHGPNTFLTVLMHVWLSLMLFRSH